MKFFTGIQTVNIFNAIYDLLKPYLPNLLYWRGSKKIITSKLQKPRKSIPHKVSSKDQFLLVLLKLRLGLMNQDLADRFQVWKSTISSIFTTWVMFLEKYLGDALIVWLPREIIATPMPPMFRKHHKELRCIIDCTEVFIEKPKSLDVQATTWSDYKNIRRSSS